MSVTASVWVLIVVIFIAANLPWLNERFLIFIEPKDHRKKVWMRLFEWLLLYFLCGLLALGMEKKMTGQIHPQDWEFYAVGFCLFIVFAFPGFIYRHELKKHLTRLNTGNQRNAITTENTEDEQE